MGALFPTRKPSGVSVLRRSHRYFSCFVGGLKRVRKPVIGGLKQLAHDLVFYQRDFLTESHSL